MRVSTRDVALKETRSATTSIEHERKVRCEEALGTGCDECGKGMCFNEVEKDFVTIFGIRRGDVHGSIR